MRGLHGYLTVLRVTGPMGFVIGAATGLLPWHAEWPGLSLLEGWRGAALGWLVGVVAAVPVGWMGFKRASASGGGGAPRWRRALWLGATALALAPAVLWLTIAIPGGVLQKALLPARRDQPNIIPKKPAERPKNFREPERLTTTKTAMKKDQTDFQVRMNFLTFSGL